MTLFQTIKRRVMRASKRLDHFIGYRHHLEPALSVTLNSGYEIEITYTDLAHLVRKADEYAANRGVPNKLKNWRELR